MVGKPENYVESLSGFESPQPILFGTCPIREKANQSGKIPDKLDLQLLVSWVQSDLFYKRAENLGGFAPTVFFCYVPAEDYQL